MFITWVRTVGIVIHILWAMALLSRPSASRLEHLLFARRELAQKRLCGAIVLTLAAGDTPHLSNLAGRHQPPTSRNPSYRPDDLVQRGRFMQHPGRACLDGLGNLHGV